MQIDYPVADSGSWTEFERLLVISSLQSHLLEPSALHRRRRIHLTLLAGALPALESETKQHVTRVATLKKVKADIFDSISAIATSRAVRTYTNELVLDLSQERLKDKRDERLRWLLGTAMTVRVMYDAAEQSGAFGTTAARNEIIRLYKPNPLFSVNDKDLRKAWTYGRNVASLAAALLECISERQREKFDLAKHLKSKGSLQRFFEYALFFQHFLIRAKTNRKLRFSIDGLSEVPPEFKIAPRPPRGGLWLPGDPRRKHVLDQPRAHG